MFPVLFFLRGNVGQPVDRMMYLCLFTWLAVVFFLVCCRLILEIIPLARSALGLLKSSPPFDPSRRLFLNQALAASTMAVGGGCLIYGSIGVHDDPEITETPVTIDRLPPGLSGLTIVQLTDLHIAPWTHRRFIERLVERTNALKPDLIAVTGDLVDGSVAEIWSKVEPIGRLRSRYGTFFVTGNHEYYVGIDPWIPAIESLGCVVLNNSGRPVADGVYVAGVPDRTAGRFSSQEKPNIPMALASNRADLPVVLLVHQPKEIQAAVESGVDLQLSGHTHGGQIWPFGAIVMAAQPYLSGLHRRGRTQIYVSRGAGTWGPPIRFGAPTEISKIVLI